MRNFGWYVEKRGQNLVVFHTSFEENEFQRAFFEIRTKFYSSFSCIDRYIQSIWSCYWFKLTWVSFFIFLSIRRQGNLRYILQTTNATICWRKMQSRQMCMRKNFVPESRRKAFPKLNTTESSQINFSLMELFQWTMVTDQLTMQHLIKNNVR